MGGFFDVVCVGAVNVDTIVPVERAPLDDERVTAERFVTAGGGPAATAAVALARLGARVAFCGVVGDDPEGRLSRDLLDREGVDTRWLRTDAGTSTARAVIITSRSTGGRSIVTTVAPRPRPPDVPVGCAAWIHVDQTGYDAAVEAMAARSPVAQPVGTGHSSARLSVDGGNEIPGLRLGGVSLYVPTLAALCHRFGGVDAAAAVRAARNEGAQLVVATDGGHGSYVGDPAGTRRVGSYAVDVLSTLGAGDVFHGALLAGLLDGRSLVDSADFAAAAAALACRAVDGRSGIPTWSELEQFRAVRD